MFHLLGTPLGASRFQEVSKLMTKAQKRLRELTDRRSQERQRMAELGLEPELTDETRAELDRIEAGTPDLERQVRAAGCAVQDETEASETRGNGDGLDAEARERLELRSKASLTAYIRAALSGRQVDGPEAELRSAAKIGDGIPLELWDVPADPALETRQDAPTPAPGTTGVNLDRIRPAVFAASIAPMLGIEMPRVESGGYASATISTSVSAGSQPKGGKTTATAAGFTVTSVTPKRISARLGIRVEDVAAVGSENFESVLRQNVALVLSDALDDQAINGAGGNSGADLVGVFSRLTDPTAAPSVISDFDAFASAHAGGIDGLWSSTLKEVSIVCGPATMALSARTFQTATSFKGETSAAAYAAMQTGGLWTNKRMPDSDTFMSVDDVQQAILYRKGRSMAGAGSMRTAVCPTWGEIGIDDIYSGSASGERFFTMHVLLGDVILVQPDAYAQVAFKVA